MVLIRRLAAGGTAAALAMAPGPAAAGGLFLPGSGVISTARAGAAVASTDDGEALSINPAGLAKARGTTITVAASLVTYSMQFTRRGAYDDVAAADQLGFEGQPYQTVENQPKPPLGIGAFQPLPLIAIVSDLGGRVPGLHVAAGLYTPTGYPFRDMTNGYEFNDPAMAGTPPPPTRYDVMTAESQLLFPSIAAAYRIAPQLDVGARFSAGRAKSKTSVVVWGTPGNVDESIRHDTLFTADVADGFVPTFGVGVTYRPTPAIELGAVYNSAAILRTKGTAQSVKGPGVDPTRVVGPIPDGPMIRCETGGSFEKQKACISLQLPMNATLGARYKVLAGDGKTLRADLEANVTWENWGKRCDYTSSGYAADKQCTSPGQFLIELDSGIYVNDVFAQPLEVNFVNLGLRDTYSVRLGGSYHLPLGGAGRELALRGGVAYDTAAARPGFLRASFDGASRVTAALGGSYRTRRWELNAGAGVVLEGSQTNPGAAPDGSDCNPTRMSPMCQGTTGPRPLDQRQGPDPTNPLLTPENQFENPFNQGSIEGRYLLFMLGASTWF
jgi:long-subunit fatty acid transport protein